VRRALTALVLLLAVAPVAMARDALTALDACVARLDPELDVGYDKIAARCPDLTPALVQSPWAAWLPSDWNKSGNNLSVRGLRQLRALLVDESARRASAGRPQATHVAAALAALAPSDRAGSGWWARFREWLRGVLQERQSGADSGWVGRLFGSLSRPGSVVKLVSLVALAAVAVLAGLMVLNELRAAGLLRLTRGRRQAAGAPGGAAAAASGWPQIASAAAIEQPRLLLELIAARLAEHDRLPPARALTLHELTRAARLSDEGARARLAELAAACERLRFSGQLLPAAVLAAALARGRELLDGLDAVRA
jgi:hypothetical protein